MATTGNTPTEGFAVPPGHVIITSYGALTPETTQSYGETRAYFQALGVTNVHFEVVIGTLVDKARNEAVQQLLANPKAQWLLFLDADMQWQPNVLLETREGMIGNSLIDTAFATQTQYDMLGAWCPLKGPPYLPTIDPGSGTWEPIEPGLGVIDVMRTGSACILIKRHVFEALEPPWYGIRPVPRPIDTLAEFDNFCRIKFDGKNPFRHSSDWTKLEVAAAAESNAPRDPRTVYNTVGEDSNLCDRAKAMGFKIGVQTNVWCNHVSRKVITPQDHVDAMAKLRSEEAQVSGVLSL